MTHAIFNKATIARYLKVNRKEIEIINHTDSLATILINNTECCVTKNQLKQTIINDRKAKINQVEIHSFGNDEYIAHNKENINSYIVLPHDDYVECECHDYQNLKAGFGSVKVACKHIYKYLNILGVSNLIDYSKLYDRSVANIQNAS